MAAREAIAWDARFELWLAAAMRQYLDDNPLPEGACTAADGVLHAEQLQASGEGRLLAMDGLPGIGGGS